MSFLTSSTATKNAMHNTAAAAKEAKITPINTLVSMSIILRIFEDLLRLFLDPVEVALGILVGVCQDSRASRAEYAIVKLLMSFSSCFVYSHNLVYCPFRSSLYA